MSKEVEHLWTHLTRHVKQQSQRQEDGKDRGKKKAAGGGSGGSARDSEEVLFFMGQRESGKSSLLHGFVSPKKTDKPKPTVALEYTFARRTTGRDRDIVHVWELAGGLRNTPLASIPLRNTTPRTKICFVVVCDLSKPVNAFIHLRRWLQVVLEASANAVASSASVSAEQGQGGRNRDGGASAEASGDNEVEAKEEDKEAEGGATEDNANGNGTAEGANGGSGSGGGGGARSRAAAQQRRRAPTVIIVANKFDQFQARYSSEASEFDSVDVDLDASLRQAQPRLMAAALRYYAHIANATLLYSSLNDSALRSTLKAHLNHHIFGAPLRQSQALTAADRGVLQPICSMAGKDSLEAIVESIPQEAMNDARGSAPPRPQDQRGNRIPNEPWRFWIEAFQRVFPNDRFDTRLLRQMENAGGLETKFEGDEDTQNDDEDAVDEENLQAFYRELEADREPDVDEVRAQRQSSSRQKTSGR